MRKKLFILASEKPPATVLGYIASIVFTTYVLSHLYTDIFKVGTRFGGWLARKQEDRQRSLLEAAKAAQNGVRQDVERQA